MSSNINAAIRKTLSDLSDAIANHLEGGKPSIHFTPGIGLCYHIRNGLYAELPSGGFIKANSIVLDMMKRWPEHSGDRLYPVPAVGVELGDPPAGYEANRAYDVSTDLYVGEYGAARRRLLDFLSLEAEEL